MAPDASIVAIQAVNPFPTALSFAAQYAGNNGASAVSMSWGMPESSIQCTRRPGQPTVKYDPNCSDVDTAARYWATFAQRFSNPDVTFVAASGDRGVIQWPATIEQCSQWEGPISDLPLTRVGSIAAAGIRNPLSHLHGSQKSSERQCAIPDVAYDAGTAIAVYVKPDIQTGLPDSSCMAANSGNRDMCGWYGGGGTSAGAPQWAALSTIVRSTRIEKVRPLINFTSSLYREIASILGGMHQHLATLFYRWSNL